MFQQTLQLYKNSFSGLSRDIWLLALVLFVNRAGAMVIPFMTVFLTTEKSFSLAQAGMVMSCFGIGSVLGSYLGGQLTDRIGYYKVQLWALVGTGLIFFVLMQMQDFYSMCMTIFLLSTIADTFRPASQTSVAYYSNPENLTRSYALLRLAVNLGFAAGPAMGGLLAISLGYDWLFVIDGLTCLSAALILWQFLTPRKEKMTGELSQEQKGKKANTSPYQDKYFLLFILFISLSALTFMQFFTVLPVFLKQEVGFNELQIGLVVTINGVMIFIMEMPLVYAMEKHYSRLTNVAIGVLLTGLSFMLLPMAQQWIIIPILFIITLTFGEMLSMPFSSSFAMERASPLKRGEYMGLFSMGFSTSLILAPTLGMQMAEHFGYNILWLFVGGVSMVATIGLVALEKQMKRKHQAV
ncbi:MAG: MFS transporter [Saprospiraceae bacterium]|nr:MFS transporter [Saprospiraceae bacterium]